MACSQSFCSLLARDALAPSSLATSCSPVYSSSVLPYPCLSCTRTPASRLTTGALSDNEKQDSSSAAPSSIRRGILAGIVAAGSALAVFSNNTSMAAIGPGNEGACRTAEKADELLKAADKLNIEDAPRRYGPELEVGLGAISQQNATNDGEEGKLENATRSAIGQAKNKQGQFGAAARDAIGQADTKSYIGDDLGKAEGGVLKPFQQGLKNLKETVERTGADARSTVADVVSKNTP